MQGGSPQTPTKRLHDQVYDDQYPVHPINLFNPDFPPLPPSAAKKPKLHNDVAEICSIGMHNKLPERLSERTPTNYTPPPTAPISIPSIPALYYLAVSAHQASAAHLQQVFIHDSINHNPSHEHNPITATSSRRHTFRFIPDSQSIPKALSLLLFSLDLLRTGRTYKDISERDEIAFGLEFGLVACKILEVSNLNREGKGKHTERIDRERLRADATDAIANAYKLSHARRYGYLKESMQQLELLGARLCFLEGRDTAGRRACRKSLLTTSGDEHSHRYSLYMMLLDNMQGSQATDPFHTLEEFCSEVQRNGHRDVLLLICLIRLRLLFLHRRWAEIPSAIEAFGEELSSFEQQNPSHPDSHSRVVWNTHLQLHYTLYRALWHGRSGDDGNAKAVLKQVYVLVDQAADGGLFRQLRRCGGLLAIRLDENRYLSVQVTPPNITYLMTYLVSSVSRRDYLGSATSCKSIVLPRLMREHAVVARADDAWDLNFSTVHGPAQALQLQTDVMTMRIEVMLEEVTALIFRGNSDAADKILETAICLAREQEIFASLAPHFCLVRAQFAHLLGRDGAAIRFYRACSALLVPGSELGLLVEICLLACQGSLLDLHQDVAIGDRVRQLVERCRASSSATLSGAGQLLWSFSEANRVASKKKLSTAYEISQKANNNILRCLIFAFTTSVHLYGAIDKTLRQLEAGRDLARLFGGKDRSDGVGQLALGLWFAEKLKEFHKRDSNAAEYAKAKLSQKQHLVRLAERQGEVPSIPCNDLPPHIRPVTSTPAFPH